MASQSQGIHQLLQAEKRAKEKLEEAKKHKGAAPGKAKRIRQAKEEALAEADQYRLRRDREFRGKESKALGSQSSLAEEAEAQARASIAELTGSYGRCAEAVLARLLGTVCAVEPRVHLNFRASD
uniref:V-type proton ATPase subunit G n=1 Tax=Pipistrellus kuhlii TaxID=59472 RepID=A0A7J7QT21_PIPKU|nr:ATPase H+ transporting V1 subunit G3 [Pipistrellus kuhlii]